jgi:hypothetical protein
MQDLSHYLTRFDEFVAMYGDGTDEFSVEDVNEEMRRRWPFYALAGADIGKIMLMMSDEDAWYYYDALLSFGAKPDIDRFVRAFDKEFIKKNLPLFSKRGANVDELKAICLGEDYEQSLPNRKTPG